MKRLCKKVAFYGKGGIGKSTISSNISSLLSKQGKKVLHIGCDPKSDSTRNLLNFRIPTVLEKLQEKEELEIEDILFKGDSGVYCIEAGGPVSGIGCAGLGISSMADTLERLGIYEWNWDAIIYDVLGDVVCGGFSIPMRNKFIDTVYVVTTSEFMSLYAANNILKSVNRYSLNSDPLLGGIIINKYNEEKDYKIVEQFAKLVNGRIISTIPQNKDLRIAELNRQTISDFNEKFTTGNMFEDLSNKIMHSNDNTIPTPLDEEGLEKVRNIILDLENS